MMNKSYYADGRKYEPIDVINDWNLNFNLGNAVKYISRYGRKGMDGTQDLKKAVDYIEYQIKLNEGISVETRGISDGKEN